MEDTEELSRFRQQWQEEVQRRRRLSTSTAHDESPAASALPKGKGKAARRPSIARPHGTLTATTVPAGPSSSAPKPPTSPQSTSAIPATIPAPTSPPPHKGQPAEAHHHHHHHDPHARVPHHHQHPTPQTALQHFEQAVEKEGQGDLGESLKLYRKAFRMDDAVDKKYREKYFSKKLAVATKKVQEPAVLKKAVGKKRDEDEAGVSSLVRSFAGLKIRPAGVLPEEGAEVDEESVKPSPFSKLPSEILLEILSHVARIDLTSFVRLSLVCKTLCHLVTTEERIWKQLCKSKWYFGGIPYGAYRCDVLGGKYVDDEGLEWGEGRVWEEGFEDGEMELDVVDEALLEDETTEGLVPKVNPRLVEVVDEEEVMKYGSWRKMFMERPRIRFNGIYISTVNYTRQGLIQGSWNTAVHIVTYYRYLRFLPNGQVLSLLTTHHPTEVVPHFSLLQPTLPPSTNPNAPQPPTTNQEWRTRLMTGHFFLYPPTHPLFPNELKIELAYLEQKRRRYMYRMRLRVGNSESRKSAKLGWRRYWSVGAGEGAEEVEFGGLRIEGAGVGEVRGRTGKDEREKPFYFSRVGGVEREVGIV